VYLCATNWQDNWFYSKKESMKKTIISLVLLMVVTVTLVSCGASRKGTGCPGVGRLVGY
jgi:hypothetical protein